MHAHLVRSQRRHIPILATYREINMSRAKAAEKGAILERQLQALDLRKAGFTYRAIGDRLGVDYTTAYKDVQSELKRLSALALDSAGELRQMELERLDMLTKGLESMAAVGKPDAVSAYLRVMERRAKLLGLDAPVRQEVTGADGGAIKTYVTFNPDEWDTTS